jgi:hypothetical protein
MGDENERTRSAIEKELGNLDHSTSAVHAL